MTGSGGFTKGVYTHDNRNPGGSFSFDSKTLNTQAALNGALAFGGGVLPQGMGMMAGILPAALKIDEHKQMRKVAEEYYERYIKKFNRKYGFSKEQIEELVKEFNRVTAEITRLIPDEKMRDMYSKYVESYPTMYLSMIPAEALQTKLTVKCVTENKILREKIESMSSCVSTLVKNLTDLQISAGIPLIENLMFESMPDPLTAITDPMYHKYNDAIVTYHKLLDDTNVDNAIERVDQTPNNKNLDVTPGGLSCEQLLRLEPVKYLEELVKKGNDHTTTPANGSAEIISLVKLQELKEVMTNMQAQSGCQPFGDEWNHQGPTPAMNPAMCLGENDEFQPGKPRHNEGRTNLYQAKRDQNENAHWVQSGQIPALSAGGPQMVQHQAQPMQQPNQWAGVRHMPGVDSRPAQPLSYHPSMQQMPQGPGPNFNMAYPGAAPAYRSSGTSKSNGSRPKNARSTESKKKRASAPKKRASPS